MHVMRAAFELLLLLSLLSGARPYGPPPPQDVQEALKHGDLEGAIFLLENAHMADPENIFLMVQLGGLQHQRGSYENAVSMFVQARDQDPKHPLPVLRLAQILPAPGYDDAINLLRKTMKLCRGGRKKKPLRKYARYSREARSSLIHLYMLTGRHSLAERTAAQIVSQNIASAEDLTNLAAVRRHAGDANGSIALLRDAVSDSLKALDKDGLVVWPHYFEDDEERERQMAVQYLHSSGRDLASIYYGTNNHQGAVQLTTNLLHSDATNPNVHLIYALSTDRQAAQAELQAESQTNAEARAKAEAEAASLRQTASEHFAQGCKLGRAAAGFRESDGDKDATGGDPADAEKYLSSSCHRQYARAMLKWGRGGLLQRFPVIVDPGGSGGSSDADGSSGSGDRDSSSSSSGDGDGSSGSGDRDSSSSSSCTVKPKVGEEQEQEEENDKILYGSGAHVCDIDQRDFSQLSVKEFLTDYVDKGRPVLLFGRGLIPESTLQQWRIPALLQSHGALRIRAATSSQHVPMQTMPGKNFTADTISNITLREFVETTILRGGGSNNSSVTDPPYLFYRLQESHSSSAAPRPPDLSLDLEPTPLTSLFHSKSRFSWGAAKRRQKFIFSVGPKYSGLFFHQHSSAWNALVQGGKRWFLLPAFTYHGAEYISTFDWLKYQYPSAPSRPLECTQRAGQVMFVPEGWRHAVISTTNTVSCAMEVGYSNRECLAAEEERNGRD